MKKVATINARIEPRLKHRAEAILHDVGLSTADAIRIFYRQICLRRGLPCDVRIPNKTTVQALEKSLNKEEVERFKSVDELFDDLNN